MKTNILFGILTMLLGVNLAHAQAFGGPAPDLGAGKKRAATCFACHNADGIAKIPGTPHLAGQERSYLENALRAYRDGQTRQNATMNAMAKPLTDRDITNIAAYFSLQSRMSNGQTAAQAAETLERIRPVAYSATEAPVAVVAANNSPAAPANATAARSGEAVYNAACAACHGSGAAGAPKLGEKSVWAQRIAQGQATLVEHAIKGYKGMPAKGACGTCSDMEIKAAVEYLVTKAK